MRRYYCCMNMRMFLYQVISPFSLINVLTVNYAKGLKNNKIQNFLQSQGNRAGQCRLIQVFTTLTCRFCHKATHLLDV